MVNLYEGGVLVKNGLEILSQNILKEENYKKEELVKNTIAYSILEKHNYSGNMKKLNIKFDAMASHDITYVGIIQTARASGMEKFPIPYVLTNCHNSLCAVGGTINEDDHVFGLSAAKKYGGIYVPAHQAVIHQYMREMMAGCGKMIIGSDSHTRYGALGTIAIGEGGGELAKQLLEKTYDIDYPEVIGVYLTGKPKKGIGPQDVALAIIGSVFKNGYVKNKIMEFIGDGIQNLGVEFRNGIDVMTTETTCLSSIWMTDEKVKEYLKHHNRENDYKKLIPNGIAYYDGLVYVDLSKIESMIALPFHPSNVYSIKELNENLDSILEKVEKEARNEGFELDLKSKVKNGKLYAEQGIIAGCAGGTYDNIVDATDIIKGHSVGNDEYNLSIYPSSQPTYINLVNNGVIVENMKAGVVLKTAFCGPCFGAGDTPANKQFSIRHTTRNFPNREGSKPGDNQMSYVALMDARSIAASSINGGALTPATDLDIEYTKPEYDFDITVYEKRVYNGFKKPQNIELKMAPNIQDWPKMPELTPHLLVKIAAFIEDQVTTTDELIPSGETSSYRSNPRKLSEFTLSRKVPTYVGKAKEIQLLEIDREKGIKAEEKSQELQNIFSKIKEIKEFENINSLEVGIGSSIYANKPGDGSAREQAASCQRVLGGWANIAKEYATKRYRSNLINWGILPFTIEENLYIKDESYIFIPNILNAIDSKENNIVAYVIGENINRIKLSLNSLTDDERDILKAGCLINYNRK